jgi:hypothetical protein
MVRRQCAREYYLERGAPNLDGEKPRLVGIQIAAASHRSIVSRDRLIVRLRDCFRGELNRPAFPSLAVLALAFRHLVRCAFFVRRARA